jgi:hypothetical protein
VAFFKGKLSDAKRRWSTNYKEFYSVVHALEIWEHYLIAKEVALLYLDH